VGEGELVVFGSSALAFWMVSPPASRDVDVWCLPADRGHAVQALMGELSWYHDKHGIFAEVWAPETFAAPTRWRDRARTVVLDEHPRVRVVLPHPHDVLMSLERMEVKDREHVRAILGEFPLDRGHLDALVREMPHRLGLIRAADRIARFEAGLTELQSMLGARG
jgi:hypothetical protein